MIRKPYIVCAAIRHKHFPTDIICAPRHADCFKSINNQKHFLYDYIKDKWICGFVDQDMKFYTRQEAWKIADANGQIRRPTGFEHIVEAPRPANVGDEGLLFSENLY